MPPSNKEIYDRLRDHGERLATLENQMTNVTSENTELKEQLQQIPKEIKREMKESQATRDIRLDKHETKLGKIEKVIYVAAGAAVVLQPLYDSLLDRIGEYLRHQ